MDMKKYVPAGKVILLAVLAVVLLLQPGLKIPYIDRKANRYFSDVMTKATVAYGICRVINAAVSVLKESQLQVEPAGIGVSLAVGQVLDPLDDMTERTSDVLVTAIVSLGIQKIIYELCLEFAPFLVAAALITLAFGALLTPNRAAGVHNSTLKLLIIIVAARLCLPLSAVVSSYLNENYFAPEIAKVKDNLAMKFPEVRRLTRLTMPKIDGVLGTVKNGFIFVGEKSMDFKRACGTIFNNAGQMVTNLLKLSYLYVALFIIQVILLPIGSFWLLVRLANALCGTNLPYLIRHNDILRGATPQAGKPESPQAVKS